MPSTVAWATAFVGILALAAGLAVGSSLVRREYVLAGLAAAGVAVAALLAVGLWLRNHWAQAVTHAPALLVAGWGLDLTRSTSVTLSSSVAMIAIGAGVIWALNTPSASAWFNVR